MLKVKDFYDKINQFSPYKTAYDWDNSGLLIGDMEAKVCNVLFTLDITDKIVNYAINKKFDLIIAHHPIILFQTVKNITQKKLLKLIENRIAVICAHTNLDTANGGVNFVLAKILGLQNIQQLSMSAINQYQICVYTPPEYLQTVMTAMNSVGAGIIGNYSHCATFFETKGQFKPIKGANPFLGQIEKLENVNEIKLEVMCEEIFLPVVINAMFSAHPYETPSYTVIPLKQKSQNFGIGCYGTLMKETKLKEFANFVKEKLNAPIITMWTADKNEELLVKNVAVCGGAGNSLIGEAVQRADVFVSADFTYHQFLEAPIPVIDAGHYFTENPVMKVLSELFSDFGCKMEVLPTTEHDINNLKYL